ncbi:MAG: PD40 domain-containing protein [Chloroflexi bacterium]|nr:PD40 domain-containing protein [Chloroflexota bacterium]
MSQQDARQLLRDGIEAAREGERQKARELFEKVVELEENNEKGWMWLASVMDTDEEKRICLTNVLQINPDNERAQKELAKIEARLKMTKNDEEVIAGVTRRQMTLYVGGAAVFGVVILAVVLIIIISNNNARFQQEQAATAAAQQGTDVAGTQIAEAATGTAIVLAQMPPTLTPTVALPTLRPTWTPLPGVVATLPPTPLPQPVGVPGFLVGWRGRDITGRGFLSAALYPLDGGGNYTTIGDEEVRNVTVEPREGNRVLYTRYFSTTATSGLEVINRNGTQPQAFDLLWQGTTEQFLNQEMPSFSPDGTKVVFVAEAADVQTRQIYIFDLNAPPGGAGLVRFTQDTIDYTYPVWSPDGTRIAVVRNDANSLNPGEDIVVFDVATRQQLAQVTNNGGAYVEAMLNWVNDTQIVYAFAAAETPNSHDLGISAADGSTTAPDLPARDPQADDIYPVFVRGGAYLAFSSNRGGAYDIYILNVATNELFQLTNSPELDYPGGWFTTP